MPKQRSLETRLAEAKLRNRKLEVEKKIKDLKLKLKELRS